MEDYFRKYIDEFKIRMGRRGKNYRMSSFHFHYWYEIMMLVEGNCKFPIEDKVYEMKAGDVLLIPPNVPHFNFGTAENLRICVEFTLDYMKRYFTQEVCEMLLRSDDVIFLHLKKEEAETFVDVSRDLINLGQDNKYVFSYFGVMLAIISNAADRQNTDEFYSIREMKSKANTKLSSVIQYIESHAAEIEKIEDIADACYISRSHLARLFRQELNISVMSYLNSVKLHKASELLLKTNNSIVDVSIECGFNSAQYFSRVFKNLIGCTPHEYRKKYKKV